jgi:hypothetical protein
MASNRFTAVPEVLLQLPQLAWPALAGNPLTGQRAAAACRSRRQALPFADLEVGALLGEGRQRPYLRARNTRSGTELALKVFKAAHTSDGTPQSELAAGMAVTPHPSC